MAADKRLPIFGFVLVGVLLHTGCVPIPTVPHGLGVVPDKEAIESFVIGKTTRADVLLLMGEPRYRLEDDRFFMYEWDVAYGYFVIPYVGGGPFYAPHYLCLEFGSDSCLVRQEAFMGAIYGKPEKAKRKCMNLPEEEDESDKK